MPATAAGAAGRTFIADRSKYAGAGRETWTLDTTTGAPVSLKAAPFTNAAMQSYQGARGGQDRDG